jgi:hypothetical protein
MRKTYLVILAALLMSACGGLGIELKPAEAPTAGPDVQATVAAQVAATLAAQAPSPTPGVPQAGPTHTPGNTSGPDTGTTPSVSIGVGGLSVTVAQNNQQLAYDCGASGEVFIDGNGNTITLSGQCLNVALNGSSNTVMIEAVANIFLNGDGNRVLWQRSLSGSSPAVVRLGSNNTVSQGALEAGTAPTATQAAVVQSSPTPAPQDEGEGTIVVAETSTDRTIDCTGQSVDIIGSSNDITLVGACNKLDIESGSNDVVAGSVLETFVLGNSNTVVLDAAGSITILGSNNHLTWKRALNGDQPAITNFGSGNTIDQAP